VCPTILYDVCGMTICIPLGITLFIAHDKQEILLISSCKPRFICSHRSTPLLDPSLVFFPP
jgi:hypothetical protein